LPILISGAAGQKKIASLIKKETFVARFRNWPLLGFAFCNKTGKKVGWVECNETQQILEKAQPNLRNKKINHS
jgi:hypothetical protein